MFRSTRKVDVLVRVLTTFALVKIVYNETIKHNKQKEYKCHGDN
jgi:hypothetical protein